MEIDNTSLLHASRLDSQEDSHVFHSYFSSEICTTLLPSLLNGHFPLNKHPTSRASLGRGIHFPKRDFHLHESCQSSVSGPGGRDSSFAPDASQHSPLWHG